MAEWDRPARRPASKHRERPLPEPARETDPLPEVHPEQHWAPWETPSRNPGRVAAEQVQVPEHRPKRDRDDNTGGKRPGGAE
ncbi:MAG TPA: hypothetical protein VF282_03555 [Bacillota bacterium]